MDQQSFTISFVYHLVPDSLKVRLSADVEMAGIDACIITNIRRVNVAESSLMPVFQLRKINGHWVHDDSHKETHLSHAISNAVNEHLAQAYPDVQKAE